MPRPQRRKFVWRVDYTTLLRLALKAYFRWVTQAMSAHRESRQKVPVDLVLDGGPRTARVSSQPISAGTPTNLR